MRDVVIAIMVVLPVALVAAITLKVAERPSTNAPQAYACEEDLAIEEAQHTLTDDVEALAPIGNIRAGRQFRVTCPQVDGGTVAHLLTPTDGGTAGKFVPADSVYVAPVVGSTVKVRQGFGTSLTPSLGWEIGPSARDGVGISVDLQQGSDPTCVSAGNAQAVDVIVGVQ